jgi:hypothetical protein
MNSPEIRAFIRENSHLFWWIKPEEKEHIDASFLVEAVLNYGNECSVKRLFELLGIQQLQKYFFARLPVHASIITRVQSIISRSIFNVMHKHILTAQQIELLPLIKEFAQEFYLVGGTAIALYMASSFN